MRRFFLFFLLLVWAESIAQKRDSRSVAMVGATTTIADGIYAVGYNPALIAFQKDKPFMLQLGGFDFGLGNNYLSLVGMNKSVSYTQMVKLICLELIMHLVIWQLHQILCILVLIRFPLGL